MVGSLDEIRRLALLLVSMSAATDSPDRAFTLRLLRDAMRDSDLGVNEVRVLDATGTTLLAGGMSHGADPEQDRETGFGEPWAEASGHVVMREIGPLNQGSRTALRITLDPVAFSATVAVALPSG